MRVSWLSYHLYHFFRNLPFVILNRVLDWDIPLSVSGSFLSIQPVKLLITACYFEPGVGLGQSPFWYPAFLFIQPVKLPITELLLVILGQVSD